MKRTIIQLLVEDIKHNQLLTGLYSIGLNDDDKYTLNLDLMIAEMMGVSPIPDAWLDIYHKTMLEIDTNITEDERQNIAENLYERLVNI